MAWPHFSVIAKSAVAVKWPNDVLIGGAKCVGILLESERLMNGRMAVVIGCGVNVAHMPQDTPYHVTSLTREGATSNIEAVFGAVANGLETAMSEFRGGAGFEDLRVEWLRHATGLGAPCRVNLAGETLTGRFEALDNEGRLVLMGNDGSRRTISAGDLFFLQRDERSAQ